MPQPAASEEVFKMTIAPSGIDERCSGGRIDVNGGDCPMASEIHKPNGKSRNRAVRGGLI
jgi:hypothetical protein